MDNDRNKLFVFPCNFFIFPWKCVWHNCYLQPKISCSSLFYRLCIVFALIIMLFLIKICQCLVFNCLFR